jgi:8-amino-7-oxononanoate synthase
MFAKEIYKKIDEVVGNIHERDLYPDIRVIEGRSIGDSVQIEGTQCVLMCGYDYLGLGSRNEIISSVKRGLDLYGTQSGGTPLVSGTLDIHKQAENAVASLIGTETSMLFTSGALANIGVIPAIISMPTFSAEFFIRKFLFLQQESVIFSDELNHATIVDGCRLSKAKVVVYKHKDINDLKSKLAHTRGGWKIIVTDGVFSMDGDIAPLPELVALSRENNAWLIVDDAHSVGVLGETGAGTAEHFGIKGSVDVTTGALGKALGILGGYAAVSNRLAEYLRITARPGIFSGSLPPALAAGLIESIEISKKEKLLRQRLWENASRLRGGFKDAGLDSLYSEDPVPIIPLMIGEDQKAIQVSRELQSRGFFAPAIRWPAVPKGTARIRFTVQANNTTSEIDALLKAVRELDAKYVFAK